MIANLQKSKLLSQLGSLSHYVLPLKGGSNSMQHFLIEELTNFMEEKSSDESTKPTHCNFSTLPVKFSKKFHNCKNDIVRMLCLY